MGKRLLTDEQLAELRALDALTDKEIDTSDIPEIGDDRWRLSRKGNVRRPAK